MGQLTISIVTPCYNEEENIDELCERVSHTMSQLPFIYEHIFIDNCSSDFTVDKIKKNIESNPNIKLIINNRNFGHIRSPYHAMLQSRGDACILIASDLQDPPEMIPEFLNKWQLGYKSVMAVKPESDEAKLLFLIRKFYYKLISKISETPLINNATGAGLYDKSVIELLKKLDDPYPYFRGIICEIGHPIATVPFKQPRRTRGITSNNFYTLYDVAMLGITNHSKVPLRIMTIGGFVLSFLCLIAAIVFVVAKFMFWNSFQFGMAPILIGLFFIGAMQMFFIGLLGEYIGSIHTKLRNMPLVIEKERINF